MERREHAVELKRNRHNCCQAVLCAFEDELDVPVEQLRKLGAAFGGGMGCMEGTCGALVAAQMLLGLIRYEGRPVARDAAGQLRRFSQMCGATLCKEIKGRDMGVVLCDCDDCVRYAVDLVEELL